jgi:hypothetical protein
LKTSAKTKRPKPWVIPGVIHANIQLPESLHQQMKAIRLARREAEGADVRLCRIYREAVEQYLGADSQKRILTRRAPKTSLARTA